ncbi:MAG: heme ABC exporter ATP-binding protein CcmA [Sphingopyxis sp.]
MPLPHRVVQLEGCYAALRIILLPPDFWEPRMSGALIRAQGLACQRGTRMLWHALDMALCEGEAVHIIGANGIGKSSLLRIIAGLLPAAAGSVECTGGVALLDENPALDRDRTLGHALGFWARVDGQSRVDMALATVGMAALADVPVRFFSTGQRKRAALARLLVQSAPIWLLDEPSNGLDRDGVAMLEALIAAHRAGGGGALIASHQPLALAGLATINLAEHQQ